MRDTSRSEIDFAQGGFFSALERGSTKMSKLINKWWLLSRAFDIPNQSRVAGKMSDAR